VTVPTPKAPHPTLADYYAGDAERAAFVRTLFNRTARYYDAINRYVSFGSGDYHRRYILRVVGLRPGQRVLDVAVGTGLLARQAVRITGDPANVIGLDLSEGMLAQARRMLTIPLIQGRAEALPIADASVDLVTMGYAVRHVDDLVATLREYRRVLRPNGTLLILEMGRPGAAWRVAVARLFFGRMIPTLCSWLARDREAGRLVRYYWDTIETCVAPAVIIDAMRAAGFADVHCRTRLEVFQDYIGRRDGA
jgi:demethylmenaquinone methyltransferase/2-methoxy-6-polyprenyl-1,4-benzoquinol methylase